MCTVSYFNTAEGIIITSNRDERLSRPRATTPEILESAGRKIVFARDQLANGTWFMADSTSRVAVLLNGAFEKHISKPPYRLSRGIVLMDLFQLAYFSEGFLQLDLSKIEPFQVLYFERNKLQRMVWDGDNKHLMELDPLRMHVFSSATLYDAENRRKRENWFAEFYQNNAQPTAKDILEFHSNHQKEDTQNGLVIDRQNETKTFSVSQVFFGKTAIEYTHFDLLSDEKYELQLA